jgi:hypothetical protein
MGHELLGDGLGEGWIEAAVDIDAGELVPVV